MEWNRGIQAGLLATILALSGCSKAGENWLRLLGDPAEDVAEAVVTDASGNVYVAGFTSGNRAGQAAAGSTDAVVAKYNASGDLEWEKRLDGPKAEQARGIALHEESLFVVGFASAPLASDANKKDEQIFVTKLNLDGEVQWSREYGDEVDAPVNATKESGEAIAVGPDGSLYVAGFTINSFGKELSESFDRDAFLLKLAPNGELVDQLLYSTPRDESAYAVHVGPGGVLYVAGETAGSLGADEGQKNPQEGMSDAFVVRVSENDGWTRLFGTAGMDSAQDMAVDGNGNVWIAGNAFQGTASHEAFGGGDGFIAHFDAAGNLKWDQVVGGASMDQTNAIVLDEENSSVYVTGMTWSDLSNPKSTENAGQGNVYVARYDAASGAFIRHAQKITAQQTDWGRDITLGPFGVVVAGFAGGPLESQPHGGANDMLLWKLNLEELEPKQ